MDGEGATRTQMGRGARWNITSGGWGPDTNGKWVGNKRQLVYIDAWVKARVAGRVPPLSPGWLLLVLLRLQQAG